MQHIKERMTNITKRLTFKNFKIVDFDNTDEVFKIELEWTNPDSRIIKTRYYVNFKYSFLEELYENNNLKYDVIQKLILKKMWWETDMSKYNTPISSRAFLKRIQKNTGRDDISFDDYIQELRRTVAINYSYIMSNSSYDEMVLDLIELGELSMDVLPLIKFKKEKEDEV